MYLKKIYDQAALAEGRMRVMHVEVRHLGLKQKFSPDLVARGAEEGWITLAEGNITLKTADGPIAFRVVRVPGLYCCHCGVAVHGSAAARAHIAAEHPGQASPDPENPSGYMVTHAYKGVQQGMPVLIGKGA